ncbi:hypothetical protein ACLB2K_019971 [Fragaria x ananassa]
MDLMTLTSNKKRPLIRRISRPSPINSLDHDVLSAIFSLLDDCFDLTNCSLVCKTWSSVITKSKQWQMGLVKGLCLEEMAVEPHRLALQQSRRINVDQWKAHAANVDQCRKENELLLTDGRDKVMRLWSVKSHKSVYKFEGEYGPLVDFDFDESTIVGLVGSKNSRICVWRCNDIIGMTRVLNPLKGDQSFVGLLVLAGGGRCVTMSSGLIVFAGSTSGYVYCWDLRTRKSLWNTRVSGDAVFSVQQLRNATSTLVVGGADGVLRLVDHNTGEVVSRIVLDTGYCALPSSISTRSTTSVLVQRLRGRRLSADAVVDDIPTPPITCVAVGMKKVITTHNRDYIRTWKFN